MRRIRSLLLALVLLVAARPAAAYECWTGWGYWVAPHSLGFLSGQLHLVTRGPADWLL